MVTAKEVFDNAAVGITALVGEPDRAIIAASALSAAGVGSFTFAGEKFAVDKLQALKPSLAGATVVCTAAAANAVSFPTSTLLVCDNPRLAFMRAIRTLFTPPPPPPGIHATAVVHPTAQIDAAASIGAYCVIAEQCSIGPGTVLYPHVTLYANVRIGADVVINSGTVIGADGFGYERNEDGALEKFLHIGGVVIEDHVEIGTNTSIDRGTLGDTRICEGARIDNQVHISHNVVVGARSAIIAQAMIGGSVKIGMEAWIAPSAVLMNQIEVGANGMVGLAAVATKSVGAGQVVMGSPAQDAKDFKATRAVLRRLIEE